MALRGEQLYRSPDPVPLAPGFGVPAGACDTHAHVYGPHQSYSLSGGKPGKQPPEALLADYLSMLDALGVDRGVLVQPSVYGTDNQLVLDAIATVPERLRGIAVLEAQRLIASDLRGLRDNGIRGLRFNTRGSTANSAGRSEPVTVESVLAAGSWLADSGLHLELLMPMDRFEDADLSFADFPADVVIDHMGYPDPARGLEGAGFSSLLRWLDTGRCWVKLSAPYRFSSQEFPYAETRAFARRLVEAAPERMVWASDWPHAASFPCGPDPERAMPNDGALIGLLSEWAPDQAVRDRILVDNPALLYGFPTHNNTAE